MQTKSRIFGLMSCYVTSAPYSRHTDLKFLKLITSHIESRSWHHIRCSFLECLTHRYFPHLWVSMWLHLICRHTSQVVKAFGRASSPWFLGMQYCFCDCFLTHCWSWHLYVWLLPRCAFLPGHRRWSLSRE